MHVWDVSGAVLVFLGGLTMAVALATWLVLRDERGAGGEAPLNFDDDEIYSGRGNTQRTGGTTHLLLASDGQLGVGTSTPAAPAAIDALVTEPGFIVPPFEKRSPDT